MRVCEGCGTSIDHKSRLARTCGETCKKRVQRNRLPAPATTSSNSAAPTAAAEPSTQMATVVQEQLEAAGRLNTVQGQAALVIARRLDDGSRETGASLSSLIGRLETTLARALEGAAPAEGAPAAPVDLVDEIAAARAAKFAS